MNNIERLEMLSESIKNEIDELNSLLQKSDSYIYKAKRNSFQNKLDNIVSNLENLNDSVYGVFEDLNYELGDIEELKQNYDILKDMLRERLSHDEKVSMRIKYGIDLY